MNKVSIRRISLAIPQGSGVVTRKHQRFQIGGFNCQIRIFPDDLNIVQGFCEVQEVGNPPDPLVSYSLVVLSEALVSGLSETLFFPDYTLKS